MALTGQWTTQQAIKWFTLRLVPLNWILLIVEGLFLAWNYFNRQLKNYCARLCGVEIGLKMLIYNT